MLNKLKRTKMVQGGRAPEIPGAAKETSPASHRTPKITPKQVTGFLKGHLKPVAALLLILLVSVAVVVLLSRKEKKNTETLDIPEYTELSPELKEKLKTELQEGPPELKDQPIPYTE